MDFGVYEMEQRECRVYLFLATSNGFINLKAYISCDKVKKWEGCFGFGMPSSGTSALETLEKNQIWIFYGNGFLVGR